MYEVEIMNDDDNNLVSLFGFRVTLNVAVILSFIALAALLHTISWVYNTIIFLSNIDDFPFSVYSEYFRVFLIGLITSLLLLFIYLYLLTKTVKLRQSNVNNEKNETTWFGFSLTNTSIMVLLTLSLIGLIESLSSLYHYTNQLIEYLELLHDPYNIIFFNYLVYVIQYTILPLFYIYTLIRCNQIRSSSM